MSSTISPNMSLTIPTVGANGQPGPTYALNINTDLSLLDSHDHSPGRGVQITPAGLNINTSLSMQGNNLTSIGNLVFSSQASSSLLNAIYVKPGTESPAINDLWFNDGNGNVVQITAGGQVNATAATIPGESYAAGTFFWKQGTGSTTPANFDIGSITIRPNVALTTNGVTLSPPTAIASQYQIFLPLVPVSGTKFVMLNAAGELQAQVDVDNATLEINSNVLQVKDAGITQAKMANNSVGTPQIIDQSVTTAKLALDVDLNWSQTFSDPSTPSFNVRIATTTNDTLSGLAARDGVTPIAGDLILAKNQTTASANGVYVAGSGAWTRDTSYDTVAELNFAGVHVTAGTVNANTNWWQNNFLTSLSDSQVWTKSSTQEFVVPAGVEVLSFSGCGGGGGGGGGGGNDASNRPGGGGGGGGGGVIERIILPVTPGQSLAITLGFGGTAGTAGTSTVSGLAGGTGLNSSIIGSGVYAIFKGGGGGGGGGTGTLTTATAGGTTGFYSSSGGAAGAPNFGGGGGGGGAAIGNGGTGGTQSPLVASAAGVGSAGGGGGYGTSTGQSGASGGESLFLATTSTGGAPLGGLGGGGGGGGGTAFGVGANGGNASGAPTAPSAAAANSGGGGGGGGAHSANGAAGSGAAGSQGGSGKVIVFWVAPNP